MNAFDMSKYTRVIATGEGRIHGEFVVHGSDRGIFRIDPMEVTIYSEDRSWGRILNPRDFDVDVSDGVATVGGAINPAKAADLDAVRGLMNELLGLVVRAFNDGPGSVVTT